MDSSTSAPLKREPFVFAATDGIYSLQCYTVASIAILYYDHILTFSDEFQKIWNRKISFINTLFIINRYMTGLGYIPIMYFIFHSPPDPAICRNYIRFPAFLSIITQTIISVIVSLRCYALYDRSRWVLGLVSVLGLAVVASFALATTKLEGLALEFGGIYRTCVPDLPSGPSFPKEYQYILAWVLSIVFDSVIFALTLFKTANMRATHAFRGPYGSLANLLLRDGSMYFAIMAMSYVIHLILFYRITTSFNATSLGNNAFLTQTISVTMMSRLILNLNGFSKRHAQQQSEDARQLEVPL